MIDYDSSPRPPPGLLLILAFAYSFVQLAAAVPLLMEMRGLVRLEPHYSWVLLPNCCCLPIGPVLSFVAFVQHFNQHPVPRGNWMAWVSLSISFLTPLLLMVLGWVFGR